MKRTVILLSALCFAMAMAWAAPTQPRAVARGLKSQKGANLSVQKMAPQAVQSDVYTFSFQSKMNQNWTASVKPHGFETSGNSRGMQYSKPSNVTLTLKGAKEVTNVEVICSSNTAGSTIDVKVGATSFGSATVNKETDVTKTFSGESADGDVVLTLNSGKSLWIKTIKVTGVIDIESDTVDLSSLVGFEIGYYPSYSTVGDYNYSVLLYSEEENDYYPMIMFDIYTTVEKAFAGTYNTENENVGEYSYYLGDEDTETDLTDADFTISQINDTIYTISGVATDEEGTIYKFNLTAPIYYYNAEYTYEPETPDTLALSITSGEEDNTYLDYGEIDLYYTTEDGDLSLMYIVPADSSYSTIPDGTFPIEEDEYDEEGEFVEKGYGYFSAGYYYGAYYSPTGSYYATDDANYYLVSGTVKIETVGTGKKMTLDGVSYYGSKITGEYTISSTAVENVEAENKVASKKVVNGRLMIVRGDKQYNALGTEVK